MRARYTRFAGFAVTLLGLVLVSCSSAPPKPTKAKMTVAAVAEINPDAGGRPSPVVIRVYQLKDDAAFSDADFFAIFDDEAATLGSALLMREEFVLTPGDRRQVELPVSREARFVGVVAAFRDIRNAQWRALAAAPKKGLTDLVKKDAIEVTVERARVTLAVAD